MNWTQSIEGFGRYIGVERGLSPHTRRAYESDVRQLTVHTGAEVSPARIEADHIRAWSFFRWLIREGVIREDPTAGLPMPKLEKRLPRPLSVDDCEQLITKDHRVLRQPAPEGGDRERRSRWMTLRDRALVELLYGTGIRIGELVALDVRDLALRALEVRVMGKGRKERIVPIPEQARHALDAWLEIRRHSGVMSEPRPASTGCSRGASNSRRTSGPRESGSACASPSASAQLRNASARYGCRSAGDSRATRARESIDDPEIYGGFDRTPSRRL